MLLNVKIMHFILKIERFNDFTVFHRKNAKKNRFETIPIF